MKWKTTIPWEPIDVPGAAARWEDRLGAVIADLDVERAARYKPTKKQTWCNIYVTDVVRNMGFRAPSHWMTMAGEPTTIGKGREMRANSLITWLNTHGARHGWVRADRATALDAAARGHLVLVGWHSGNGEGPGHIAVVVDDVSGQIVISQAGRRNYAYCSLEAGFGSYPVEFWVQSLRGGPPHEGTIGH